MAEFDMPESVTGKLGPLPVWAWGAIAGCAVVAYIWFAKTSNTSDTNSDESTDTETTKTGSVTDLIDGAFTPGTASGSSDSNDDTPDSVDTNSAWGLRAVAYLVGKGIAPITAQRAIATYLASEAMSADQAELVNQAIVGIGQPPTAVDIVKDPGTTATYKSYRRDAKGQIYGVKATGAETALSDSAYLALGMPTLVTDLYQTKTTTLGKAIPVASLLTKYKVTRERLMVINRWKSIPELKKGLKVKVPA